MATGMEFGLLGPLVVRDDGTLVALPPGKQRAVLAALLMSAGRVVPIDELAEVLWGPAPPAAARVTIQNYVKRLRKALADAGKTRIATRPGGYVIDVSRDDVDVARFEALFAAARQAATQGRWPQAGTGARAALELWRGRPFADIGSETLTAREAPRLEEIRLQAVEIRIDADIAVGRTADVVAELRQLTVAHPLREHLHAQLMLTLYRTSRQGDALAAYHHARRALIEDLGTEPGPELRRLHQRILAGDPALDGPPAAAPPAADPAVTGPVPAQLPTPIGQFTGRMAETAILNELLDRDGVQPPGAVVISAIGGTAGVGKTALAVHWAHQVAHRFPDGQLYADLRGFGPAGPPMEPGQVICRFLAALGVPSGQVPPDLDAQAALYRSVLAGKRVLVLLDNARDADQVRALIPGGTACLTVITSRNRLTGLVATNGAQPLDLDVLSAAEARELLTRRLGPERVGADPAAADELIGLCARLPLALAIAAARCATRPGRRLADTTAELRGSADRLDTLNAGDAATNIRAVFAWSYRNLSAPAARMFRLLGVHPGPDISWATAASLVGCGPGAARAALYELARASLLTEHASGRFSCHDLLRAYAGEQAHRVDSGQECQLAIGRVLDHYVHSAHAAVTLLYPARGTLDMAAPGPGVAPERFAGLPTAWAWLKAESTALIASAGLAAEAGFDRNAWQLAWALTEFLDRRGLQHDWAATQQIALAAAGRTGDEAAQSRAHRDLGFAYTRLGRFAEGRAHLGRALRLCQRRGDTVGAGRAHFALAQLAELEGDPHRALGEAQQALELYTAAGFAAAQARALNAVGWYHALLGRYGDALSFCTRAIDLLHELGDRPGEADAWDSLGYVQHRLGHHAEALACYQRAVDPFRDIGDLSSQAQALDRMGDTHQAAGDAAAARDAWTQALAIFDGLGHRGAGQVRVKLDSLTAPPPDGRELVPQ